MVERRTTERRSISYYLRVIDAGANQIIGHLSDITLHGLKIDCQKPLLGIKEYRLRIYTTSDVADKDFVEFLANTRWCRPDPLEPGLYNVGFEIVKMDPHDTRIVQNIVDKYSTRETTFNF
jgi:hypothetical protein